MKRHFLVALLLLLVVALPALAQEATLAAPEVGPTATKLRVTAYGVDTGSGCVSVRVAYLTAANAEVRQHAFRICTDEDSAIFGAWHTAIGTPRANETGVANRRMNFRILGFLLDRGLLPSGTTIAP